MSLQQKADFSKAKDGLLPAIIQDYQTKDVLMLGYMNSDALQKTVETKQVTFFSRSKNRLWTKGEESGNFLVLKQIELDCDQDTFLIQVKPKGPTCHKGTETCWGKKRKSTFGFLTELEQTIEERKNLNPDESYIASLFEKGINKIAQKVGEEAVEVVIEAKDNNDNLFLNESADLLFHYLILLQKKGFSLQDIEQILKQRSIKKEN